MIFTSAINDPVGLFVSIFATGVEQTDTVTLTTPGGKTKNGKWTIHPNPACKGLPEEYQQVKYLESHGNEYIDTGIVANGNTGFWIDSQNTVDSVYRYLGVANTGWAKALVLGSNGTVYVNGVYSNSLNTGRTRTQVSYIEKKGTSFDGSTWTYSVSDFTSNGTVVLFALRYNGGIEKNSSNCYKLFGLKFYDSNTVIRDYVPCYRKSDNEPGLYDIVNDVFYTNAGTGTFAIGADVTASIGGFQFDRLGEYGTYTLTANNGTKTVTEIVLVDVVKEYQTEIVY